MQTQTVNSEPMVQFTLWLTPELLRQMEQYSAATGVPLAEIMRRGATQWLQQQQQYVRAS